MARNVPRKGAVVTGAGSGIGRSVATQLLRAGNAVLAVDLNTSAARDLEAAGAEFLQADVSSESGRGAIVSSAKRLSSVDYLVNAAGIIVIGRPLEFTLDDWRRVFAVNVEGTYFLCQALAGVMAKGGAIVNISSSSAKLATTIEAAPYAATKAAVLSITRSLAYTLAPRQIRVNAICPGIIDTPMERSVNEKVGALRGVSMEQLSAARDASVPLGRGASADECAAAILFLLSDQAGYMTGEGMNFSGGQVVW
jgi:NAD(P)-dependent dehydrogenase (short-subunit alcohol dehydrogenase family)